LEILADRVDLHQKAIDKGYVMTIPMVNYWLFEKKRKPKTYRTVCIQCGEVFRQLTKNEHKICENCRQTYEVCIVCNKPIQKNHVAEAVVKTDDTTIRGYACQECMPDYQICSNCGKKTTLGIEIEGESFCSGCVSELFVKCDEYGCGNYIPKGEEHDICGETLCEDCVTEFCVTCSACGTIIHNDNAYYFDGNEYCEDCFESNFSICPVCEETVENTDGTYYNRRYFHEDCFCDNYNTCESCGEVFPADDTVTDDDGYNYCSSCWENEGRDGGLLNFDVKVPPIFYETKEETECLQKPIFYMGIELETELEDSDLHADDVIEYVNDINKKQPDEYMYCKMDGSLLNGVEIVSHPATYDWLNENFDETWGHVCKLRERGMKSFKTDTCGIHIHISRTAFSILHLYKFMRFFHQNKTFITTVSRREQYLLDRWASIHTVSSSYICSIMHLPSTYKYNALHLTKNTVECRIFRGTMKPTSFRMNYEFIKALYEYTKDCSLQRLKAKDFAEYLYNYREEYPNIFTFVDKFAEENLISNELEKSNTLTHSLEN